jgi:competence protein ComEC
MVDARVLSVLAIALGAPLLLLRRRAGWALVGLVLVAGAAAMLNSHTRFAPRGPLGELARTVPRCVVTGTVIEAIGGLGSLVTIDAARCGGWTGASLGVASVAEPVADPGARFEAEGWMVPLGTDGFDRARRRMGAEATLEPAEIEVIALPRRAHAAAARVRAGLRTASAGVDPPNGALLRGLTIGDTSDIAPETIDVFRAAGLSHVLAVSGSNVAIVLGAVLALLGSIGHRTRIGIGFGALGLFVLIVGPDASVMRAGVMGAIALACLARGRSSEPLAALAVAVIAVIGLRPGMLFSVGMHLSVAATAGIVILAEAIAARLGPLPRPVRLMIAASLAAQIAVTPILVLVFEEISLVAPVANALALPAVAPATVIGLGAGVVAIVSAPLGSLAVQCIEPALTWILRVAHGLGGPGWAVVHVGRTWGWVALAGVLALGRSVIRRTIAAE